MRESPAQGEAVASRLTAPPPLGPCVPAWTEDALLDERLTLVRESIPNADVMPAATLRAAVADAYRRIGRALQRAGQSPLRLWNYMPDPGVVVEAGLDRYMVFNAGRYDGYQAWPNDLAQSLATASGVGVDDSDITIFCLASRDAGTPVENPRQTPAWRYSARYGPMPPCFARATLAQVNDKRTLLIGGTASIVGEDSHHHDDTAAQLDETLANLAALVGAAREVPARSASQHSDHASEWASAALARLVDLRAYVVRAEDAPLIESVLRTRCPALRRLELTQARLCRRELLVEIEGLAEL